MIKVTVWNEFVEENMYEHVKKVYPHGIHTCIKNFLETNDDMSVRCVTLSDPDQGLSEEILSDTDVLIWWGHQAHEEVTEENENEAVQIKLTRSEQREQVFMLLFSKSFTNTSVDNMVQDSSELFMGGVSALAQAEVEGIVSAKEELDEIISRYLKKGWTLSRISKPSLAILELAVYEIKYLDNVPASVAINEAVELAKKYTIDESGFVNGILVSFVRDNGEK